VTWLSQLRVWSYRVSSSCWSEMGKAQLKATRRYKEEILSMLIEDLGRLGFLA